MHSYIHNHKHRQERGNILFGALIVVLLAVCLGYSAIYFAFGKVVPPDTIGLRRYWKSLPGLGAQGYQSEGLEPGLHWQIPAVSTIDLLPRGFKFVNFGSSATNAPSYINRDTLQIPTADGSMVITDVSVVVRFFDSTLVQATPKSTVAEPTLSKQTADESSSELPPLPVHYTGVHGGPKDLITEYSLDTRTQMDRFAQLAESHIKKHLSQLATVDYYNPVLREEKVLAAQNDLNSALATSGIEVWGVLLHRYSYANEDIDTQIFEKNLQGQAKRLNEIRKKLSEEQAITKETIAKLDANITVLRAQKTSEAEAIRSRGQLYESQKIAQGDFLVTQASAEITSEKQRLFAEQKAKTYVGYEMVPLLGTLKGGIISNIDPLNIDEWVKRLTGNQKDTEQRTTEHKQTEAQGE